MEDIIKRFEPKYQITKSGCWEWQAFRNPLGYGMFRFKGQSRLAHRVAYSIFKGVLRPSYELDHLCRNPSCVNPDHLEQVKHHTNVLRGSGVTAINANKTHCPNGHSYAGDNLYILKSSRWNNRYCKACTRVRNRDYMRRKRQENK